VVVVSAPFLTQPGRCGLTAKCLRNHRETTHLGLKYTGRCGFEIPAKPPRTGAVGRSGVSEGWDGDPSSAAARDNLVEKISAGGRV